jgi:hypothetical protein
LPESPTPDCVRCCAAGISNRLFKIVPQLIHPVADEFADFSRLEPPVRRIADDGENRLALLDAIGLMPFGADIVRDKAQSAFGRRRARFGKRIGEINSDPLLRLRRAHGVAQPVMRDGVWADERFDSIEIIDLRGDVRRGERAGVTSDQGVFNIQVGTAITLAIADRSKADGELAGISYIDSWAEGLFSRDAKLAWLKSGEETGMRPGAVDVVRGILDDMKPEPFQREEWPSLSSCFAFRKSGVKTQNDPALVKVNRSDLKLDVRPLIASPQLERQIIYRPLDRRWLYNDPKLVKRHGPELQSVWGANNVALYAMPFATGAGPAVWCHGLLPDYHAFSGRGGYAFPLRDNRPGHGPFNISRALLDGLAASYGVPVSAEGAFDAMLALLSATFYTLRFAEDLEDVFPNVPFPSDHAVFLAAAELGREIRAVETFARLPHPAFLTRAHARVETEPDRTLDASDWSEGEFFLCADHTGRVSGVARDIWDFSVSGYRLLPRWLDARKGLAVDHALISAMRDVVGRIAALIDLFARADRLLIQILPATLTKNALGLGANETANNEQ